MTEPDSVVIDSHGVLTLSRGRTGRERGGGLELWELQVRLADDGLLAETSIWLGVEGFEKSLADFFAEMAEQWRSGAGWDGVKQWVGMEGGLTLSCTYHRLGHVVIAVELWHLSGSGWAVVSEAVVDAGQLDALAEALRALLTVQHERPAQEAGRDTSGRPTDRPTRYPPSVVVRRRD